MICLVSIFQKGFSSLTDSLVIDISSCNQLLSVVESPIGSGNYIAKFEVLLGYSSIQLLLIGWNKIRKII